MPRIDNEKFYTSAIELYGTTAKGVNWHSKRTQEIRFDIILELLPKNIKDFSIVDAGCGFGDLYLYMLKKKKEPKEYIGIDTVVDMYSIASEQTGKEIIIADITKDSLPRADYYVCSGAMNVLNEFETHLFIQNCFSTCREGFIFNILYGEKDSETYNYLSKDDINNIAKSLHVEHIEFHEDYLSNDITVGFFK